MWDMGGLVTMVPAATVHGPCRRAVLTRPAVPSPPQPSSLLRRHRLKLVSTSKVCDMRLREPRRSADEIAAEGDAMAAHPALVAAAQAAIATGAERALATPSPAMAAVARVAPLATASVVGSPGKAALKGAAPAAAVARGAAVGSAGAEEVPGLSPVDRVTASLAAAAAAAGAAAAGAYSAAVPYAGEEQEVLQAAGTGGRWLLPCP